MGIGLAIKEFTSNIKGIHEIKILEELPVNELVILTNANKYHNIAMSQFINGLLNKK